MSLVFRIFVFLQPFVDFVEELRRFADAWQLIVLIAVHAGVKPDYPNQQFAEETHLVYNDFFISTWICQFTVYCLLRVRFSRREKKNVGGLNKVTKRQFLNRTVKCRTGEEVPNYIWVSLFSLL